MVHNRHKKIGIEKQQRAVELRRRYTDDGKRMLVHLNNTAHHSPIILEMSVPKRVGEHDIRSAVRAMLIGGVEEMAKIRLKAQCVEVVPASFLDPGPRWTLARIQPGLSDVISHEIVKAVVAVAQIEIVGIRLCHVIGRPAPECVEALLA